MKGKVLEFPIRKFSEPTMTMQAFQIAHQRLIAIRDKIPLNDQENFQKYEKYADHFKNAMLMREAGDMLAKAALELFEESDKLLTVDTSSKYLPMVIPPAP